MKNNLVWVGIRESDIAFQNNIRKSITVFGSGNNGNISLESINNVRCDYNNPAFEPQYYKFIETQMHEMLKKDHTLHFIFYDNLDAHELPQVLQEHIDYNNDFSLLNLLYNKMYLKMWLQNKVPILPYFTLMGKEYCHNDVCDKLESSQVVVQGIHSCGGHNTLLFTNKNHKRNALKLNANMPYTVSAYRPDGIPINIHAIIYSDEIVFFPGSIQILSSEDHLGYMGSDFTAYGLLDDDMKAVAITTAKHVCNKLRHLGYRGVCGIDMLICNGIAYFSEVNARFQTSTALLNYNLFSKELPSIYEYHTAAFTESSCPYEKLDTDAEGSIIGFNYSIQGFEFMQWLHGQIKNSEDERLVVIDDRINWTRKMEEGTYLYKVMFRENISYVDHGNLLRLHTNLFHPQKILEADCDKISLMRLKARLFCQGITMSQKVKEFINKSKGYDYEEFYTITLCLFDKVWISAPSSEALHSLSSFSIELDDMGQPILCQYGQTMLPVTIHPYDSLAELPTGKGHYYKDIAYLGTDRLRIYHRSSCAFRDIDKACSFCDLIGSKPDFTFDEIKPVIDHYFCTYTIRHCLIGGGSAKLNSEIQEIIKISSYIKGKYGVPIYVMCLPVSDIDHLRLLKKSGVDEIAFNIEMADRELAEKIMPGKGKISLAHYYESLEKAVSVFGHKGEVRSVLLLGLDTESELLSAVNHLCVMGAAPILTYLRPIDEGIFRHYIGPSAEQTERIYWLAEEVCNRHGLRLGPACSSCQNNVLQVTI